MVDVAYKPVGKPKPSDVFYEQKEIKLKIPFSYSLSTGYIASSSVVQNSIGYPKEGKTLYITGLQLTTSVDAISDSYFRITDLPTTNILFEVAPILQESTNFTFNPPLKITSPYDKNTTPSGCQVVIGSSGANINGLSYNIQGYYE